MSMGARTLALVLLAGAMAASPGSAQHGPLSAASEDPQTRTGLTCAWTMLRVSAAVGRRCPVGDHAAFQNSLEHHVSRLEDHARQAAPETWAGMLARGRDIDAASEAQLCTADAVSFYRDMTNGEPEAIRDETDRVISLRGPIEFGACR